VWRLRPDADDAAADGVLPRLRRAAAVPQLSRLRAELPGERHADDGAAADGWSADGDVRWSAADAWSADGVWRTADARCADVRSADAALVSGCDAVSGADAEPESHSDAARLGAAGADAVAARPEHDDVSLRRR